MAEWVKSTERLPEFNQLVVAYLEGSKEHSGLSWHRVGYAFMVRHEDSEWTVADQWSAEHYSKALERLGADLLEVKCWLPLEAPRER